MAELTPKTRDELLAILRKLAVIYGQYIDDRYLDDGCDFFQWLPTSLHTKAIEDALAEAWKAVYAEGEITPVTPEEEEYNELFYRDHRFDDDLYGDIDG